MNNYTAKDRGLETKCSLPILTDDINKPKYKQFDLNEIYSVDYNTTEGLVDSAVKINSWYGFFANLLPVIGRKRDIIKGNITKLEFDLKHAKASVFIQYKTGEKVLKDIKGNEVKLTDALTKELVENNSDVCAVIASLQAETNRLDELTENLNTVKGILDTLNHIQDQIKTFGYVRRGIIAENRILDANDALTESIKRK